MRLLTKIRTLFPERKALGGRAMRASAWSISELGVSHFLRLGSNLIMTRLLLPEAFGLMAIIVTLHMAFVLLTDIGIKQSITRSPDGESTRFLRVMWVIQIVRSSIVTSFVLSVAAAIALLGPQFAPEGTVYADPMLPGLIAVSSLVVLMNGFQSVNVHVASRRLQLSRVAILNISGQVVSITAMVSFAQFEASVWALLLGMMTGSAFRMVVSHFIFDGPRMRFEWDKETANDVWHFGKWIMGSSSLAFVARSADRFILGALLDKETFGFYVIAIMWVQSAAQVSQTLITRVGFPMLSEVIRERSGDTRRVMRKFMFPIDALTVVGFVTLFFLGGIVIEILYPANYVTAASFIPFLAAVILRERFIILNQLLLGFGDSKALLLRTAVSSIALCTSLPISFHFFGVEGALLAVAISPIAGFIPVMFRARPLLGPDIRQHVAWFIANCVVAVVVYLFVPAL